MSIWAGIGIFFMVFIILMLGFSAGVFCCNRKWLGAAEDGTSIYFPGGYYGNTFEVILKEGVNQDGFG